MATTPSFKHHWRVYGFWAPAIDDYVAMNIPDWTGHPRYASLMKIEEPYEYRSRLTMPKLMINATGDQFFLLDSSQFYFDDLPGEKHLRYVPNADHSLRKSLRGSIDGQVTDAGGRALSGMALTLTEELTGRTRNATSSGDGEFLVTLLPAGVYRLEATGSGYRSTSRTITLLVNQINSLCFTLQKR